MKSIKVGPIHHEPYGGFHFSLLTPNLQVAYLSTCKEYLLDVYYASIHGVKNSYQKVPTDEVFLLIKDVGEFEPWAVRAVKFINSIEKEAGMEQTELLKVVSKESDSAAERSSCVFHGSADWVLAPPLLSLYAAIPRIVRNNPNILTLENIGKLLGGIKNPVFGPIWPHTTHETVNSTQFISTLSRVGPARIFGEDRKENWKFDGIHGCGIIMYATEYLKQHRPEWYDWQKDYAKVKV